MKRHRRVHGKAFADEVRVPPQPIQTAFHPPIVNEQVTVPGHTKVQWMTPNQASRSYTRYTVDPSTSAAESQPPVSWPATSTVAPDGSSEAERMYVDPQEFSP